MPRVVKSAQHTDEMIESGGFVDDFDGTIDLERGVLFAPFDYGGNPFRGKKDYGRHLAAYLMVHADEGEVKSNGEPIGTQIFPYSAGKLTHQISSTEECDDESTSDIDYPGDPTYPDGGDDDEYYNAFEEIWNATGEDLDEKEKGTIVHQEAYRDELLRIFGGVSPFCIQETKGSIELVGGTNWSFFLDQAAALFTEDMWTDLPNKTFGGLHCHLAQIAPPSRSFKNDDKDNKGPKPVLVITQVHGKVKSIKSKATKSTKKSTTKGGDKAAAIKAAKKAAKAKIAAAKKAKDDTSVDVAEDIVFNRLTVEINAALAESEMLDKAAVRAFFFGKTWADDTKKSTAEVKECFELFKGDFLENFEGAGWTGDELVKL